MNAPVRRRLLLATLGALAAPFSLAQPRSPRVVGLLSSGSGPRVLSVAMAERGWVEGRDIRYEWRRIAPDAEQPDREAAELVQAGADVLVGQGILIVRALARATRTVPIVCLGVSNPVGEGFALSLQRPGKNVTGLSYGLPEAAVLQVGALQSLVPGMKRLVILTSPAPYGRRPAPEHEQAASRAGITAELLVARSAGEFANAIGNLQPSVDVAWIAQLPADLSESRAAAIALERRIATHSMGYEAVRAGMLMSYWLTHAEPVKRGAAIMDKVLRGEDPGRIPFELPDRTEFALNRSTAATLGLRIPPELLLRVTDLV